MLLASTALCNSSLEGEEMSLQLEISSCKIQFTEVVGMFWGGVHNKQIRKRIPVLLSPD